MVVRMESPQVEHWAARWVVWKAGWWDYSMVAPMDDCWAEQKAVNWADN